MSRLLNFCCCPEESREEFIEVKAVKIYDPPTVTESDRSHQPAAVEEPGDGADSTLPADESPRLDGEQDCSVDGAKDAREIAVASPAGSSSFLFHASLVKTRGTKLGVLLDPLDEVTLFVVKVLDGPVMDWNAIHPDAAIHPGDRVLRVQDQCGRACELLEMLMEEEGNFEVDVQRPEVVHVHLTKSVGPSLCVDLKYLPQSGSCLIARIDEGALAEWLRRDGNAGKVAAGDRIFHVNGAEGVPPQMVERLCRSEAVVMYIYHYPSPASGIEG